MQKDLTQGNLLRVMLSFSLPFLLSNFLQTLYGLGDMFIIGLFNGAEITTAVSVGSQVMHMLTVMITGLAMGSTVMISRALGRRDGQAAARTVGNTLTVFLLGSLAVAAVLILAVDPILHAVSTPAESFEQARWYLVICFAGVPFITAYNVLSSVFRGLGDSRTPMYFVAVACAVNILLDLLFVGPFGMQAAGAALATVIAQAVSVLFAALTIRRRGTGLPLTRGDLRPERGALGSILKIGFPIALQDGFIQISFLVITAIANSRGVEMAAAVGIVEKIIGILFLVPSAMLSAVSAVAAQNLGAEKPGRARAALGYGVATTVGYGIVLAVLFQFAAAPAVSLFTKDASVITYGGQYLSTYVFDCLFAGIHFCFSGYFCARGLSILSFAHNIVSVLLARIPLAYLATVLYPDTLTEMGMASTLGSVLSAIICTVIFLVLYRRDKKTA